MRGVGYWWDLWRDLMMLHRQWWCLWYGSDIIYIYIWARMVLPKICRKHHDSDCIFDLTICASPRRWYHIVMVTMFSVGYWWYVWYRDGFWCNDVISRRWGWWRGCFVVSEHMLDNDTMVHWPNYTMRVWYNGQLHDHAYAHHDVASMMMVQSYNDTEHFHGHACWWWWWCWCWLVASCSTSLPGGHQVDGLPPASHTRASCSAPRLGRGQI